MKSISIKTIICTAAVVSCVVTAIVVNADNQPLSKTNPELSEVSAAIEASNIKDSMFSETDVSADDADNNESSPKKAKLFATERAPQYDIDNTVVVYSINDISNFDNRVDGYQYIVPVKKSSDVVALVTMSKGKTLDELQPAIDILEVSDEQRQKITEKVSARVGKWYAAYMEEISPEAGYIFDEDKVVEYLKESGISGMQSMTYFRYKDTFLLQVKTDTGNYIIPSQFTETDGLTLENKVYNEGEFQATVNALAED